MKETVSASVTSDEAIFARVYPALRRFANVVRDSDIEADDLVQEATARALALRPLHELDDPELYLRAAILNIVANERRRLARQRGALARESSPDGQLDDYPSDLDDLRQLSSTDRAAIYLAFVVGLPFRDVGDTLCCSEPAARVRAHRALRRLRRLTGEELRDA